MTNEYRRTLCDIDIILNELRDEERNMIPLKLQKIIHDNRLENYQSQIRTDIPIEQQQLHPDTQDFLAMLYLNYWCKDENEKREFKSVLVGNEEKFQKELSDKYDVYNVFKQRQEKTTSSEETNKDTQMIVYKESIIKKILNKIFALFRRR